MVSPGGAMTLLDWEFSTYGPPAYDLGSLIASLILAEIAVSAGGPGLRGSVDAATRAVQSDWLLRCVEDVWHGAAAGWWECKRHQQHGRGNLKELVRSVGKHAAWEAELLREVLAFAGCCICRLVVGQHSYQLFAEMPDQRGRRVECERAALAVGRRLLAERQGKALGSIKGVVEAVRAGLR
jgi:5-methylthioribose kinase